MGHFHFRQNTFMNISMCLSQSFESEIMNVWNKGTYIGTYSYNLDR